MRPDLVSGVSSVAGGYEEVPVIYSEHSQGCMPVISIPVSQQVNH